MIYTEDRVKFCSVRRFLTPLELISNSVNTMNTDGNVFEIFSAALYRNYEYYTFQLQQFAKVIKHIRRQQHLLNRCKTADINIFSCECNFNISYYEGVEWGSIY